MIRSMNKNIKYCLLAVLTIVLVPMLNSCDDWTEPESLDLKNPTFEEQNAQLYADYLTNLKTYKAGEHSIVIVSYDNSSWAPVKQAERLSVIPDSVDFICLNNPKDLHPEHEEEMVKIRNDKGTKTIYTVSYDLFETQWNEKKKANPELTEEEALNFIGESTDEMLALCDQFGFDGIMVDYTGRSLVSLTQEALALYNARQQSFFGKVMSWKESHQNKNLFFYGNIQYLVPENMDMLNKYDFLIIKTALSTNMDELTLFTYLAIQAGEDAIKDDNKATAEEGTEVKTNPVPTDRFLACVQLPKEEDKDKVIGYWNTVLADGSKTLAHLGAAQWVVQESVDFTRKGIFIMDIHNDYYNKTYKSIRDAIGIMNPNK